ncbi:hypothetical protein [Tichowtungia aerotolerans]|uniref:Uncharacterized protein n=1 Tax=Tichowtungia aerotolerans TaxID=2697043 RepID=A0A6P1M741_9BACT|nr:hypothetical protein [Tichowtungia aerotolerans]QHI70589.1 hypothetical protein GT409_14450 [Tichowtungia aerotolerans]
MSEHSTTRTNAGRPDEDILLDLNFVPQWAKKKPGENHYHAVEERSGRPPRRGGERRERRDSSPRSGRRPPSHHDRKPREVRPRSAKVDLPVTIKFLPEQKRLSSLVRQIHHSKRAYPLIDLAHIFLSDPRGHLVKLEVEPGAEDFKLYQGKRSKMVATDRDVLLRQLLDNHLEDFFEIEEIEVETPSGVFPMIGKIDDILIGPPNHHSYTDRLAEIHRTSYAGMPFERFKEKVQTVRDEELIEQWKQDASKKTVYRLKDGGKEFSLLQAEEYVKTHIAEAEIEEVTRAVLPSSLARRIKDYNLIRMVREAWQQESRFPISLAFAMRAAFRHLHLYTFKAGKNINFITAVKPDPIAPEAAVDTIRAILEFLADHPGSTRLQLVEGLRPGAEKDSERAHEILNPIRWLVEKGHIIEFFNGTLSVPSRRRR